MSTQAPQVSVVVPAYNAGATLLATLASVQAQTWTNWELLVVDNGSSDHSATLTQAAAHADARIRLVTEARRGVSVARNRGVAEARGAWLLFLDADDRIEPGHLHDLIDALERESEAEVAYCGWRRIGADQQTLQVYWPPDLQRDAFPALVRRCAVAIHSVLVRRATVIELGGFDESLETCEDWDLWQRVARTGIRWTGLPLPNALYLTHAGSLSGRGRTVALDGLQVIARGHAADPRVREPDPRYVDGLRDRDSQTQASVNILGWCAGMACGAGRSAIDLLPLFIQHAHRPWPIGVLVSAVIEGLVVGSVQSAASLTESQAVWWRPLEALIEGLAMATGDPLLLDGFSREFELQLLRVCTKPTQTVLRRTVGVVLDLENLDAITPPAGVDTLHFRVHAGGRELRRLELPLIDRLSVLDLTRLLMAELGTGSVTRHWRGRQRLRYALALGTEGMSGIRRAAKSSDTEVALPRRMVRELRGLRARAMLRSAATVGPLPRPDAAVSVDWPERWIAPARLAATAVRPADRARPVAGPADPWPAEQLDHPNRKTFWEQFFQTPDPWNYGTQYEHLKYLRTLSLLPQQRYGQALELACAEGRFSAVLAPRVENLIATDISATAVERARVRCQGIGNLSLRTLDFVDEPLPADLDLLVCSEVLYYLDDHEQLRSVARKFRDALRYGGRLLTAHAYLLADDPHRTGFDWDHPFGVESVSRTFASTEGMALERSIVTDAYRIDLLRRLEPGETPPVPRIEHLALESLLEPEVEAFLIPDGAVMTRKQALLGAACDHIPVLMYHRVAEDGPSTLARFRVTPAQFEAQLLLLRRHGYHTITSGQLWYSMQRRQPIPGRPVVISFDDAYTDFHDQAWPRLRRRDFTAEVFVVTGKVGQTADWDADLGDPAPLMDWAQIEALSAEGVQFGSHLHTHRAADSLDSATLIQEAVGSRALLEAHLGKPVSAIAHPYGIANERAVRTASMAGYAINFTTQPGFASVHGHTMRVPRIEVRGDWSLDDFAAALGIGLEMQPVAALVDALDADPAQLDHTLQSLRAQSHSTLDIRVLVDAQQAAVIACVQRHAEQDERVQCLSSSIRGAALLRLALVGTQAPWIAFARSGDRWHVHKIERQLRALHAGGGETALVYCWTGVLGAGGSDQPPMRRPEDEGQIAWRLCEENLIGGASNALLRRQALTEVIARPIVDFQILDEAACHALWLQLARVHEVRVLRDVLAWSPAAAMDAASMQRRLLALDRQNSAFRPWLPDYAWAFDGSRARLLQGFAWQILTRKGMADGLAFVWRQPETLRSALWVPFRECLRSRARSALSTPLRALRNRVRKGLHSGSSV